MLSLMLVIFVHSVLAETIDIGIFESATPGKIDIMIRPDFDIEANETVTAILYTVRWNDPAVTITTEFIFPFFISPQGEPEEFNGYYYQVFAAVPVNALAMAANQEYTASTFAYANGDCARFEIIEDDWTLANNGNFYIEFLGGDITGIIYEPILEFGSVGGMIAGGGTISLGETTGDLTLLEYTGNINTWQKRLDDGDWDDIALTSGLVTYSEVPSVAGLWEYRCEVQQGTCPAGHSATAQVLVLDTITGTLTELRPPGTNIGISATGNVIHIKRLTPGNLAGTVKVFTLTGREIFNADVSAADSYSFPLNEPGLLLVVFMEEQGSLLSRGKVLLE